jgi:hypothetical protein
MLNSKWSQICNKYGMGIWEKMVMDYPKQYTSLGNDMVFIRQYMVLE